MQSRSVPSAVASSSSSSFNSSEVVQFTTHVLSFYLVCGELVSPTSMYLTTNTRLQYLFALKTNDCGPYGDLTIVSARSNDNEMHIL